MLRDLIDKGENMQKEMDKQMEAQRKYQKTLNIKNTETELKNTFDGLINRLNIAEERLSRLEHVTIYTSKCEKQKEKMTEKKVKQNKMPKNCWTTVKGVVYAYQEYQKEKETKEQK